MSADRRRLERHLASSGARETDRPDPLEQLERTLVRRELGRDPDPRSSLADLLDAGSVDAFVAALRGTMEHFVRHLEILGSASSAYRRLSGVASARGVVVAGQVIAECVACYRLILGREPDDGGFLHFVERREVGGLTPMVDAFRLSEEAAAHFAPGDPPALADAVLAVGTGAIGVLAAATADASLGSTAQLRGTLDHVLGRVDALAHAFESFAGLAQLRFDSEASAR